MKNTPLISCYALSEILEDKIYNPSTTSIEREKSLIEYAENEKLMETALTMMNDKK